jgi:hypothetical protein
MESWVWLALIALALLVGMLAAWLVLQRRRSTYLRERFGPEYERAVQQIGDRRRAETELEQREKRVEQLQIRPLPLSEARRFADDPSGAVADADRLVAGVMQARGYPVGDFEQRAADISVDHPDVVEHYRAAHRIALASERGLATTEDLRQAMVHYRALFGHLLETEDIVESGRKA